MTVYEPPAQDLLHPILVDLTIDGHELEPIARSSVVSVVVEQVATRPARATIEMGGRNLVGFDIGALDRYLNDLVDKSSSMSCRPLGHSSPLFSGDVVGLETSLDPDGQRTWRLRAEDGLNELRMSVASEQVENRSMVELIENIADRYGMSLEVDDELDLITELRYEVFHQANETDMALLDRLVQRLGAIAFLDGDILKLTRIYPSRSSALTIATDRVIAYATDRRPKRGSPPRASGWNLTSAEVVGAGHRYQRAVGHIQQDEARLTENTWAALNAVDELSVMANLSGRGDLVPGVCLTIDGGPPWRIGQAKHSIDATGYRTSLVSARAPGRPTGSPHPAITLGVVTSVDDPTKMGRVRATLGAYGDMETDWLPVVLPGAATGAGLMAIPNVGATIVIAGVADHTSVGLVLGAIAEPGQLADQVVDGRTERFDLGTAGASLTLDGGTNHVRIDNGDGSRLELAPGKVALFADGDLDIEAPGRTIRIVADRVDFERSS